MDISNLAHFIFSFLVPLGWAAIFYPFSKKFGKGWIWVFAPTLILSLVIILAKEAIDVQASINDIACDFLGFFLGMAQMTITFFRSYKVLDSNKTQEIMGTHLSLRATLGAVEKLERKSADFYFQVASKLNDKKASGICLLLGQASQSRADNIHFMLSGWIKRNFDSGDFPDSLIPVATLAKRMQNKISLSGDSISILEAAIEFKKQQLQIYKNMESEFSEEWKQLKVRSIIKESTEEIQKLVYCLEQIPKAS